MSIEEIIEQKASSINSTDKERFRNFHINVLIYHLIMNLKI